MPGMKRQIDEDTWITTQSKKFKTSLLLSNIHGKYKIAIIAILPKPIGKSNSYWFIVNYGIFAGLIKDPTNHFPLLQTLILCFSLL